MARTDEILRDWDRFVAQAKRASPVDTSESATARRARIARLEGDWQAWLRYYLPEWFSADFAPFQVRYVEAVLSGDYHVITRAWARAHGKTTLTQGLLMYMAMRREVSTVVYVSKNEDAAIEMVLPIKAHVEHNQRLIADYGQQRGRSKWQNDGFVLRNGASFRPLGLGQSPRGTKNEERRPDMLVLDDCDYDQLVLNPERLEKANDWVWGALYGALPVGGRSRVILVNNRIGEDCLLNRAILRSDNHEEVNLLDERGQPSWPQAYSIEECQQKIDKMGTRLAQREYFNNPVPEGKTFRRDWIHWQPLDTWKGYSKIVAYLDPSFSAKSKADHKAWVVVGIHAKTRQYHILDARCGVATIEEMIGWGYDFTDEANRQGVAVALHMEEVFLQTLLYKDFAEAGRKYGRLLPIQGDKRKKPDKDQRIASLSGYFERGHVRFNANHRDNTHMRTLVEQLTLFSPGNSRLKKDGPDALEGAIHLLNLHTQASQPPIHGPRRTSGGPRRF